MATVKLPVLAAVSTALLGLAIALVVLLCADRRRPGPLAEDLLLPRTAGADLVRLLRVGRLEGVAPLWKRQERADLESYVAIHQGVIFGSLTLLTGSIWARISWGVWWSWSENQLVLFLVLFLFYCAYFMLRFSRRARARAREHVRGLRALRRRADPGLVPRDPALAEVHPPGRVHVARAADDRRAVPDVLRLPRRDARASSRRSTVELAGKRARRAPARAAGAARA